MMDKLRSLPGRIASWAGSLSAPALAAIGIAIAGSVGAGGYYAYQTYDYVQHDNDFCLSCHLMVEPYERFARSAHRGLGCKACHQPTIVVRSQMALTQIIENPDSLAVHARVTNDKCASCHINGDPEKWELIKNSAGHKVHLESKDSTLQGLQCVRCHSTSLHEFAASDKTCAQAGCHEHNKIMLGRMKDLTIHCAACHDFSKPIPQGGGTEAVLAALSPDKNECLSCHEMRVLVNLPDPDPHQGACAACHNPHTQATPQAAVESCTKAGCHTQADTLTPFHRGMGPGVLENCVNCHNAHDFHVDDTNCLSCHTGVFRDSVRANPGGGVAIQPATAHPTVPASFLGIGAPPSADAWWLHPASPALQQTPPQATPQATRREGPRFLHSQHRNVACTNCHDSSQSHGGLKVTSIADCRGCHHTGGLSTNCARCHQSTDARGDPHAEQRTMSLSVGRPVRRDLPFRHENHTSEACSICHTQGLQLSAASVDCNECHEQHHALDNDCTRCHVQPPASAHPVAKAHESCSGSGCHRAPPFATLPTATREVCLVCHQKQKEHRPGQICAECHAITEPAGSGGRAGA